MYPARTKLLMTIRVCFAGATGWAGAPVARAIARTDDIKLVAAISRTHAGKILGEVLGLEKLTCPVFASAEQALAIPCDVFFEYTKPEVALSNILRALDAGAHVVVGTSGLTEADYAEIAAAAQRAQRGALAVGNFSLPMTLMGKFAEIAARYFSQWEIIDYAGDAKKDAPSGTARELAARLGKVRPSELGVPLDETQGPREARGARVSGSQVHSLRLPGYMLSTEIIFGLPDQRLILMHDAGSSPEPYVDGALLAIRKVSTFTGLRRGLDSVIEV